MLQKFTQAGYRNIIELLKKQHIIQLHARFERWRAIWPVNLPYWNFIFISCFIFIFLTIDAIL